MHTFHPKRLKYNYANDNLSAVVRKKNADSKTKLRVEWAGVGVFVRILSRATKILEFECFSELHSTFENRTMVRL